jgi:hypothetical protein
VSSPTSTTSPTSVPVSSRYDESRDRLVGRRGRPQRKLELGRVSRAEPVDRARFGRDERVEKCDVDLGRLAVGFDAGEAVDLHPADAHRAGRQLDVDLDAEQLERICRPDGRSLAQIGCQRDLR